MNSNENAIPCKKHLPTKEESESTFSSFSSTIVPWNYLALDINQLCSGGTGRARYRPKKMFEHYWIVVRRSARLWSSPCQAQAAPHSARCRKTFYVVVLVKQVVG